MFICYEFTPSYVAKESEREYQCSERMCLVEFWNVAQTKKARTGKMLLLYFSESTETLFIHQIATET